MFDAYIVLYKTMYIDSDKIHIVWFREKKSIIWRTELNSQKGSLLSDIPWKNPSILNKLSFKHLALLNSVKQASSKL